MARCFFGVVLQRVGGLEIQIALYGKAVGAAHALQFGNPHSAVFGSSHAEVAEAERDIGVINVQFGEQPRASAPRREQLDDGDVIDGVAVFRDMGSILQRVCEHSLALFAGK